MPQTYRDLHKEFMSRYLQTGENRVMGRSRRVTAMRKDGVTFPVQVIIYSQHKNSPPKISQLSPKIFWNKFTLKFPPPPP
jgi:PAS domain S-box-containing protein